MISQMGEDKGNIDALMSGGKYNPAKVTGAGEGADATPTEKSMYNGDKSPRVPGGTAGFKSVRPVGQKVQPYPEIDADLYGGEPIGEGFQPSDIRPVTSTSGNSKVVGDMVTGMPRDGAFSGPAKIGPGNMIADLEPVNGGAEDAFPAALVGDIVTGRPTDDYPREEKMSSELSPQGLTTGDSKGSYAPGVGQGTGHGVNGGQ